MAAAAQRNLALKAFRGLIFDVQDKLKVSPATQALRQSLLNAAIDGLGELARSTEEAAPDLDRAVAHQRLAEVYSGGGGDLEAVKQLERSLQLVQSIASRSPDDLDAMELLGVVNHQLGGLVLSTNDPFRAESLCRRGEEACEAVAALDASRPIARQFRIKNKLQLGHTFLWRNMLPESLAAFSASLDLANHWAIDEPANTVPKKLVLEIETKLGDAYWLSAFDWPESRAHYLKAIAVARSLVEENPSQLQAQHALAHPILNLGECARHAGHPDEARPLLLEAERLGSKLVKADPNAMMYHLLVLEARGELASVYIVTAMYAEAANLLRPTIEQLQRFKDEGKLEGQPNYGIQYLQAWKDDLAFCDAAPLSLRNLSSVGSQRPDIAMRLLRPRARHLKGRGDAPALLATVEAAFRLQSTKVDDLIDLAALCGDCIRSLDAIRAAGPPSQGDTALRGRCADRGIDALARAISGGFRDVRRLEAHEDYQPLRAHPGFPSLIEKARDRRPNADSSPSALTR